MADDTKFEETPEVEEASVVDETPEVTEEVPEAEQVAGDEAAEQQAQSKHEERVASFAALLADLVAKGEEVVADLEARAVAADATFADRAATSDTRMNDFAAAMQERMEKAAEQFARDLDVITRAVDDACQASGAASDKPKPYVPQFTQAAQEMRERMGVSPHSALTLSDPEFVERFANFAFDDVPSDVDLPDRTRFMCWLATLLGCQGIDEFRVLLPAALNVGVEPETVKEIVYQATAYLGIGRVYPFLKATNEALAAAGIKLPLEPQATTTPDEASRYAGGEEAQVACFGEQMHGYKDRGAADYPHIAQWLVKNCFGDWYTRGGLTIPEREMVTFCYIAAQGGCEPQLRAHTAGNVQCGNDRDFLIKVVSNNVPFIGYPRSLNAMAVVEEVTGKQEG